MNTAETLKQVDAVWHKPFCAACRKEMWLLRIDPDEPGYELRAFQCGSCGLQQNVQTQIP